MSEFNADTQAIMAEALAAKGISVTDAPADSLSPAPAHPAQAAVDFMNGSPGGEPGTRAMSSTEAVMAQALVDAGRLTQEQADAMGRGEDADTTAPLPFDASPRATAQALHEFAIADGMDAELAKYYSNKAELMLKAPPVSPETRQRSFAAARAAMAAEFGEDADAWGDVARREVVRLAKSNPDLPRILERTNMGNDIGVIRALIAHAGKREMKARGYKVP